MSTFATPGRRGQQLAPPVPGNPQPRGTVAPSVPSIPWPENHQPRKRNIPGQAEFDAYMADRSRVRQAGAEFAAARGVYAPGSAQPVQAQSQGTPYDPWRPQPSQAQLQGGQYDPRNYRQPLYTLPSTWLSSVPLGHGPIASAFAGQQNFTPPDDRWQIAGAFAGPPARMQR
jgi:hypothetical protein